MKEETVKTQRDQFFEKNTQFKKIKPNEHRITVADFLDIDELEDEVWLMQCPKGADISHLMGTKIKMPGRTHIEDKECVAIEFGEPPTHAFGACNRKGKYSLRMLPVRGNIVMRNRLKALKPIEVEQIQAANPSVPRMPFPAEIPVRHPLLGRNYMEKMEINKTVRKKLEQADKNSLQHIEQLLEKRARCSDEGNTSLSKSQKRKKHQAELDLSQVSMKKSKKHAKGKRESSEDNLKWLKDINV